MSNFLEGLATEYIRVQASDVSLMCLSEMFEDYHLNDLELEELLVMIQWAQIEVHW